MRRLKRYAVVAERITVTQHKCSNLSSSSEAIGKSNPQCDPMLLNYLAKSIRSLKQVIASKRLSSHRRQLVLQMNGGDGLELEGLVTVINPENLTIGEGVHIGRDAYLHCLGGIEIGSHTMVSKRVTIYSYDHEFKKPTSLPFDGECVIRPVRIGEYVWIGMNVSIAPGTRIGNGAVIGMGTVVSGVVPKNAIVVNSKPRIVGYRDREHTNELVEKQKMYDIAKVR